QWAIPVRFARQLAPSLAAAEVAAQLARPRAAGKQLSQNGLRGACEFYTFLHTRRRAYAGCTPPSRQARELAEGQRTRESSFFSPRDPLRQPIGIGGRGRILRGICTS